MINNERFIYGVQSALLGVAVGDALGVPAEFMSRASLANDPVTCMRGGGAHGQLPGTWSDDTSMTLCLMESLTAKGVDYHDQMSRYADWLNTANYTARGRVFDVGGTTGSAIDKFVGGAEPLECGDDSERSCGNGSLMRCIPAALYIKGLYDSHRLDDRGAEIIHSTSKCTHAHKRCQMACGIFSNVVFACFDCVSAAEMIDVGVADALSYYKERPDFAEVYDDFSSLTGIALWPERDIRGSGYVLHTLQAALWCLSTTSGYAECVLKAVNLGEDTDTTAAVAGGLAGLVYGEKAIPVDWIEQLAKHDEIKQRSTRFAYSCLERD